MPITTLPGSEKHFSTPGYSVTRAQYTHLQENEHAHLFHFEDNTAFMPNSLTPFHVRVNLYTHTDVLQRCLVEAMLFELKELGKKYAHIHEIMKVHRHAKRIAAQDGNYYTPSRLIESLRAAITAIRRPDEKNTNALLAVSRQTTTHGRGKPALRTFGLCLAALGATLIAMFGIMLAFSLLPLPSAIATFAVGLSGIAVGTGLFITGMRLFEKQRQQGLSLGLSHLADNIPKVNARRSRNLAVLGVSG